MTDATQAAAAQVHLFQTHDAQGRPAVTDRLTPVVRQPATLLEVSIVQQLMPYTPRLTEHAGVYLYTEPGVGSGWLRLENLSSHDTNKLHQLMIVEDISAAIGIKEPWREDPPALRLGAPRAGNPYILIVFGLIVAGLGAFGVVRIATLDGEWSVIRGIALVTTFALIPLGLLLAERGRRRLRWWHAARAEAARRGIPLPDKLSGTGS